MKLFFKKSKFSPRSILFRKRKGQRFDKILIIGIIILVTLSLNFFQKEVKGFFYLISSPIQKTLWKAGDGVSDFFEAILEIKNLKKENEELKLKLQELLAENTALSDIKEENKVLREALEIGLKEDFEILFAQVIGKDISQDSILIDKGSKDGILEGMPVVTGQKTLVGRINEVFEKFSKVLLISNKKSFFDAKIQFKPGEAKDDVFGVVKGQGNSKVMLDRIPQDKEIFKEDIVISSSLGRIFPEGLLVGEITDVKKSDIEPFQQATVKPFFEIEEMENLFIIREW